MAKRGRPTNEEARIRTLNAATDLFVCNGYVETTVADIAEHGGCAVKTLYAAYGSKLGILEAAHYKAVRGSAGPIRFIDQEWIGSLAEADSVQAAWAEVSAQQLGSNARVAPIIDVIQNASADPGVAQLYSDLKKDRYDFWTGVAEILLSLPGAAPTARLRHVADVMDAFRSAESYIQFVNERGWTEEAWHQWTHDLVLRELTAE